MTISETRLGTTAEPGDVITRWTAATICWSTVAALGDWPVLQPSVPPPLASAAPTRAPSRVAYSSGEVVVEQEAELEHAQQQEHDHGDDHREFDQALAVFTLAGPSESSSVAHHRIGSIRITLDRSKTNPSPVPTNVSSGVTYWWS